MNFFEQTYLRACNDILENGYIVKNDRTGVGTHMVTNAVIEHGDVERMFPLPVTKKLATKSVIGELLWFLEGSNDERYLAEITYGTRDIARSTIWTANYKDYASKHGQWGYPRHALMGPIYGKQWRNFEGVDQLKEVIQRIKDKPYDRRHVITAWAPHEIEQMTLPPCHMIYQFNVVGKKLDLLMMQRSGDMFLGIPFNMASYALLLKIIAKETGYKAGKVTIIIGNAHIYSNHVEQVKEQLSRKKTETYRAIEYNYHWGENDVVFPDITINSTSQLFNSDGSIGYKVDDFTVVNYNPLPTIRGSMAV